MYIAGNLVLDTLQQRSSYLTDTGTVNAYEVQFVPAIAPGYTDGLYVTFKASTTNTGACTLKVDTNAPVPLVKNVIQAMGDQDIIAGEILSAVYDAGQNVFQVLDNPEKVALPFSTFLIDGGQIAWQQNYDYIVAADDYVILGTQYHADQTPITLAAADPFLNRIDLVVSTTSNTTVVITGAPATNPQLPSYDPATQIPLAFIEVNAGTTAPNCAALTVVYRDNVGTPTEWAVVSSNAIMMDPNSTNLPRTGTKNIEGTVVASGNTLTFTPASPFDSTSSTALQFYIRSKGSWGTTANGHRISVTVNNVGGQVGNPVIIPPRGDFGFDSVNTTTYQLIYIDLGRFAFPSNPLITSIVFTMAGSDGVMGWHIDDVSMAQNCIIPAAPTPLTFNNNLTQFGNIVQTGGTLLHNTTENTQGFIQTFYGETVYNYPYQFQQGQSFQNGTGVASFLSFGTVVPSQPDYLNVVKLSINYTGAVYEVSGPFVPGYLNDKIAYSVGCNWKGHGSFALDIENDNSKLASLFFHTLDTGYTDAFTFVAKQPPIGSIVVTGGGTGLEPYRLSTLRTTGQWQYYKYGQGNFIDTAAYNLGVKADGSVIEVSAAVGASGFSGFSGVGFSGFSGYSGFSGIQGATGSQGIPGLTGPSGYSGFSGVSGYSGFSGLSGYSGYSGANPGASGFSGYSGSNPGVSGFSGYSGANPGASGYSGFSGATGPTGTGPRFAVFGEDDTAAQNRLFTGTGFPFTFVFDDAIPSNTFTISGAGIVSPGGSSPALATIDLAATSTAGAAASIALKAINETNIGAFMINKGIYVRALNGTINYSIFSDPQNSNEYGLVIQGSNSGNGIVCGTAGVGSTSIYAYNDVGIGIDIPIANGGIPLNIGQNKPTDDVQIYAKFSRSGNNPTTSTALGGSFEFYEIDDSSFNRLVGKQIVSLSDISTGSYSGQYKFQLSGGGVPKDILTLDGATNIQFNQYGLGNFTGTPTFVIGTDVSGNLIEVALGGGLTADNGLNMSTPSNVELGGTLLQDTTIDASTFNLLVTGSIPTTNPVLKIQNTSTFGTALEAYADVGYAIKGFSNGGPGVLGNSTTGTGIEATSQDGTGLFARSLNSYGATVISLPADTNSVIGTLLIHRGTQGTAANGIGGSIDFITDDDTLNNVISNQIISKWVDAADPTRTSEFDITGVNSGSTQTILMLRGNGIMNLPIDPPQFVDNAAATTGGLVNGDIYRNGDILQIVHP